MKKFYLIFAALAAIVAVTASAQVKKANPNDTYIDESNSIEYIYDSDMWAESYGDSEELSWIVLSGQNAQGHVTLLNEIQGEKVRVIGANAFRIEDWIEETDEMIWQNPKLTGITIPDNVEVIQMAAFLGCCNLKTIDLNNVRRVDYATFIGCTGLEEIHIRVPASQMMFGWAVFHTDLEMNAKDIIPATIYVPKGELQAYIDKFAQPYDLEDEYAMTWEENVLYEFVQQGRLKEEGDGPAPTKPGDITGEGTVDVDDINILVNILVGKTGEMPSADVNGDGKIDIDDINSLINIILGKV